MATYYLMMASLTESPKGEKMDWSYYGKFDGIMEKYLPDMGQGETMATQIVTAVNRLVYKWYNDGDVYDNTYFMDGWCNDVSDCANWLYDETDEQTVEILCEIETCRTDEQYEDILKALADHLLDEAYLERMDMFPADGSIYKNPGNFVFVEPEEDEEEWW